MSEPITFAMLQRQVRRLAAERPDFVYRQSGKTSTCLYFNADGTCGCIFGHAFAAVGITKEEVARWDKGNWTAGIRMVWNRLAEGRKVESAGGAALSWMGAVQSCQDDGATWAEAVAGADEVYNLGPEKVEYLPDAQPE